jgi:hypothetical protein
VEATRYKNPCSMINCKLSLNNLKKLYLCALAIDKDGIRIYDNV